jgi:predicted Zn-dependent protease with MMP-like domain
MKKHPATSLKSDFTPFAKRAETVVREVIASLPDDLRALADGVPVFFETDITPHWLRDGVEPDSLGLFSGPSRTDSDVFECPEAPAITLFLRNLRDYCAEEGLSFEEEVRVTYLHEFGHYLGLEEGDMAARRLL